MAALRVAIFLPTLSTPRLMFSNFCYFLTISALLGGFLLPSLSHADWGTDQVALAAGGHFGELEKELESRERTGKLNTKDRHALCYAYSKTKRYSKLNECLDLLDKNITAGDRRTRLFGLEDATPASGIMRAEAFIEMGKYPQAVETAIKTLTWLREDGSDDLDMVVNTQAALSVAYTLSGEKIKGQQAAYELQNVKTGLLGDYATAKAMALARARMAGQDYQGVLDALQSDKTFSLNVFLDRFFTGSFFTGVNNWLWVELPRAFMTSKSLLEIGDFPAATAGFDRLLLQPQVKENGEIYWLLLNDRGRIAEQSGQYPEALEYYRKAIDIIETQRSSINTEASKIGFVGDKQAVYAQIIAVALRLNRQDTAYEYIERSKSRALVDLLASRDHILVLAAGNPEQQKLLDSYREAQDLAAVQVPVDMNTAGSASNRNIAVAKGNRLKQQAPELASLVTVSAMPATEIQKFIAPDEGVLEFFGHGKELTAVAISREKIQAAKIDTEGFKDDIRNFRSMIMGRDQRKTMEQAQKIYNRLLKPFEEFTANKRNLVLIPHGPLHYLPFGALHNGKDYLIDSHTLRYLPSAGIQKYLRPSSQARLEKMLILGNPDLGEKKFDLPGAEEEAQMIINLVPGSELLTRGMATESTFKARAGNFGFLHIASHGEFKSDSALQSRLLLAPDARNDGSLTVSEIYGLRLNADLVTLSACETGLGKAMSGDDVIGLNRGFLYAGSSNIIASLWQVDDDATSELMKGLYTNLKAGIPKKEALHQAQQSLRMKYPEPFYWAAFYLTGQGQ